MPLTISLRPYLTPTDGKKSLNAFPYDSNQDWRIPRDFVTIGYSTINIVQPFSFNLLALSSFSNWYSTFASSIYSTTIQSSYRYTFDGTSNSINDGGFDMWDNPGNQISLTFSNFRFGLSTLRYGAMSTFSNATTGLLGGFYITPSNQWPQTALTYIINGGVGWTNSGNIGSDGGATVSNISGTYVCPGGRSGRYWANQNFNTSDPTVCYTWFTIEQSNYQTSIISSNDNRKRVDGNVYTQNFNLTGCNIIFAQTLLSVLRTVPSQLGYFIPTGQIEGFLSTFVESAVLNFS